MCYLHLISRSEYFLHHCFLSVVIFWVDHWSCLDLLCSGAFKSQSVTTTHLWLFKKPTQFTISKHELQGDLGSLTMSFNFSAFSESAVIMFSKTLAADIWLLKKTLKNRILDFFPSSKSHNIPCHSERITSPFFLKVCLKTILASPYVHWMQYWSLSLFLLSKAMSMFMIHSSCSVQKILLET